MEDFRGEVIDHFLDQLQPLFVILYNLNYNVPEKEVLIGPEKVLIDPKKALIDLENISIHNSIDKLNANQGTKEKANLLVEKMGFDKIFGKKIMGNINLLDKNEVVEKT